MWNFRSETSFRTGESTDSEEIERTLSKSSTIRGRVPTMGFANAPVVKAIPCGSLRFLRKQNAFGETGKKSSITNLKSGNFLKIPSFYHDESLFWEAD